MLLALAAAGCSFHGAFAGSADAPPIGTADGTRTVDGSPRVTVPCTTSETSGLVVCYELEDDVTDGTLSDSSPDRHDATTSGLTPTTRQTSAAATVGGASMTYVSQSSELDRAAGYTFALWVRPTTLPDVGAIQGVLDHELQYAMAIGNNAGTIESRCIHTGVGRYEWTEQLPASVWSMVACTWDGSQFCAYRWTSSSDHQKYCHHPTTLPASTGVQGLAIGHLSTDGTPHDQLQGDVDSIHVYDHALSADQLCTEVGEGSGCLPCTTCT